MLGLFRFSRMKLPIVAISHSSRAHAPRVGSTVQPEERAVGEACGVVADEVPHCDEEVDGLEFMYGEYTLAKHRDVVKAPPR